jgi:hypothetical protein
MKPSATMAIAGGLLLTALQMSATGQTYVPPRAYSVELSGPRMGVTVLDPGVRDLLRDRSVNVRPVISQFGWQLEKQFFTKDSGIAVVNEWVLLVGGLEQSVALPSATWMVGVRTAAGTEFGVGPNLTPAGLALAMAAGVTFRTGLMNVPLNLAVVPSKAGMRVSVLTGFTMRRR